MVKNTWTKIDYNCEQLWKGCILASLAHAIMVATYPFITNEQSWDGMNYNVQDSCGKRGTVSFRDGYCVAVFRDDNSRRVIRDVSAESYLLGAPREIIELANNEAFQYVLDSVDGKIVPLITSAFWGRECMFSNDALENVLANGGELLENQMIPINEAIDLWKDFYDMNDRHIELLKSLYERKVNRANETIILSKDEISILDVDEEDGLDESGISFEEMGIYLSME